MSHIHENHQTPEYFPVLSGWNVFLSEDYLFDLIRLDGGRIRIPRIFYKNYIKEM